MRGFSQISHSDFSEGGWHGREKILICRQTYCEDGYGGENKRNKPTLCSMSALEFPSSSFLLRKRIQSRNFRRGKTAYVTRWPRLCSQKKKFPVEVVVVVVVVLFFFSFCSFNWLPVRLVRNHVLRPWRSTKKTACLCRCRIVGHCAWSDLALGCSLRRIQHTIL